ncbi:MAG: ribose transport system permease protein [Fimbriimonadaceae bacterium]|nr:ribose transport system permease protein [Fimbriimonadaceae bacterium]
MRGRLSSILRLQELGLAVVILVLCVVLSVVARQIDPSTGKTINTFLNASTLIQMATDASFFAIMAVGATMVIATAGIDLSVGSAAALSGVVMGVVLRKYTHLSPVEAVLIGALVCCGVGVLCGALNGLMVVGLGVHPFVITLGTLWVYRGLAFVISGGESILVPEPLTDFAKARLGLGPGLYPVPMLVMLLVTIGGAIFLSRTVAGRRVFAVGGNVEASRYAGVRISRVLIGVYLISGFCAALSAFLAGSYYGAVASNDANGYELYVIASAVVGGVSLSGGKGSALGALLGAILITVIHQAIRTLHWEQNYEWIIVGAAIIVAVVLDKISRQLAARRVA